MFEYKKPTPKKFYAGGFLYNPETESVFLLHRDDKTDIEPNKWGLFGGLNKTGESPDECFVRELKEENGLAINKNEAYLLDEYPVKELDTYRYSFFVLSAKKKSKFTLGEGQGFDWILLDKVFDYDLCARTRKDLKKFIDGLSSGKYNLK